MIKNLVPLQLIKEEMYKWENFSFVFHMDTETEGEKKKVEILNIVFIGFYFPVSQILNTSVKIFTALCDSAGLGRAYTAIAKILVR